MGFLLVLSACGVLESFAGGGMNGTEQGNADVLEVRAVESADGTWTFHVTVAHPDTGWED